MAEGPPAAARYVWLASFAFDTSDVQISKTRRRHLEPDATSPTRVRCDFSDAHKTFITARMDE
eukprot:11387057-Heterocapsa_arctica.AAC.1